MHTFALFGFKTTTTLIRINLKLNQGN